jgi:hypothetical protein
MRHFHVTQALNMVVPNQAISFEHYLRQPQRFLRAIMDPRNLEEIHPAHFRLHLRPLKFMMFVMQPVVDLKAEMQPDGTLYLESLACEIRGAEVLQRAVTVNLQGRLKASQTESETTLQGQAELRIQAQVPSPLKLVPEATLTSAGNAFLKGILMTIKQRLERQLIRDYTRWAAEEMQPTEKEQKVGRSEQLLSPY